MIGAHVTRRRGKPQVLAAVRAREQLGAEADPEHRDLARDRLAQELRLGVERRVPRRLLAAEAHDPVHVEVRQRAEVLLDGAERVGGVTEERLGQMVDDGDARHGASTRVATPARVARP